MNFSATVEWCNGYKLQYIQCCTSSVAAASVDCHVRQFGLDTSLDITRQITSSVADNWQGRNIFVQANEWILCNTIYSISAFLSPKSVFYLT